MTQIPLIASLYPKADTVTAHHIAAEIQRNFKQVTIDWNQGTQKVQQEIEALRTLNMGENILNAHLHTLNQVVYIEVHDDLYPGLKGTFYARSIQRELSDRFDLKIEPKTNIDFLKQLAQRITECLNFRFLLKTDNSWGMEIMAQPGFVDPLQFAKSLFPSYIYGPLSLKPLVNWQKSLDMAIPLWYSLSAFKNKTAMLESVGSIKALSDEMINVLIQIDMVQNAWVIVMDSPFGNNLILAHKDWISVTKLNGVPKGILDL